MPRLATCKKCGISLLPNEKNVFSGKSYCINCYEIFRQDADAYKALIDSICSIFEITQPSGLILKQIKEYKKELKYSYAAMTYTLWYITQVLRIQLEFKFGIALIKYRYDEAKSYFEQQEKIANSITTTEVKTRIVKKVNSVKHNKVNSLIDITELVKGGEVNKL